MEVKSVLSTHNINKFFYDPVELQVLNDVSINVNQGEFVSIVGKSGCGKSTLLYILSTMDTDYKGELYIDGEQMSKKTHDELAHVRNEKIGFVFQFHYLLPEFSVLKNVMLPAMKLNKLGKDEIEDHAMKLLKDLGIDGEAKKRAGQLSGGQKQRVAIARALVNKPLIIMGDEPTGNLDKKNSDIVFGIFREIAQERGQAMLVVTHDQDFAERTDRIIEMGDGKVIN
jgi:lipoprotein-releasing system ATP-binding protein